MNQQLKKALEVLKDGGLSDALSIIGGVVPDYPFSKYYSSYENIRDEFQMLLSYYGRGVSDPRRCEVYRHLRRRTVALVGDMHLDALIKDDTYLAGLQARAGSRDDLNSIEAIKGELENYVSDIALLDFTSSAGSEEDADARREEMIAAHQKYINDVMTTLIVAPHWRNGDVEAMRDLLLTPTVDNRDQMMIVSALTLNLMLSGDYHKLILLIDVYEQSEDVRVSQRALVGFGMALLTQNYVEPIAVECIQKLLKNSDSAVNDLMSLQKQIYDCLDARVDTDKIRQEILPNIMKNSDLRISRFGVEEKEDSLRDILHPEAAEEAMEEMEKAVNKMRSMIDRGSDVYFGGFSQMKRFPFFYNISNWFCPFFPEHPDLKSVSADIRKSNFFKTIGTRSPFCDSDRYSFVLSLNTIMERMPAQLRDMLLKGEGVEMMQGTLDMDEPVVVRRMYLQDLYRFFELFPYKSAFPAAFTMLKKRGSDRMHFYPMDHPYLAGLSDLAGVDYNKLSAYLLMRNKEYIPAAQLLRKALEAEEDVNVLNNLAHCLSMNGEFAEAQECYARLLELKGESVPLLRKYCICLTNAHHNDKALEVAYKLSYEHPDDMTAKRLLAWNLMVKGDTVKGRRYYDELVASNGATADDWLNCGLCHFLGDDIVGANEALRMYVSKAEGKVTVKSLLKKLTDNGEEAQMFALCGKSMEDLELLAEMAKSSIDN